MAHWVILKRDETSEYLNLEVATRILHRPNHAILVYYGNEQIIVSKNDKPGTYAHICAYLGIQE